MRRCLIHTLANASPEWAQEWRDVMVKQGRSDEVDKLREEVRAYKTNQGALPL